MEQPRPQRLRTFLALLVAVQFGFPAALGGRGAHVSYLAAYGATAVYGAFAVAASGRERLRIVALAAAFVGAGAWYASTGTPASAAATYAALGALAATLGAVLLRDVFVSARRPTAETVVAAVAVYLLLGALFAAAFGVAETASPGALRATDPGPVRWDQVLYFSYTSLTTMGFGDIRPVHPWTRSLAVLAAVTGTVYIATVVARLVGAYQPPSTSPPPSP